MSNKKRKLSLLEKILAPGSDNLTVGFFQHLMKKRWWYILTIFQKFEKRRELVPDYFYKVNINLCLEFTNILQEKNYWPIFLINVEKYYLNKILTNQSWEYVKREKHEMKMQVYKFGLKLKNILI